MFVKKIEIDGFKNLEKIDFSPGKSFNIIFGQNAQGKTNLLEALWIATGCRSFRNTKEKDYISFEKDGFEMKITFEDEIRTQEIEYRMQKKGVKNKLILLNGVKQNGSGKLFENFKCVAFLPGDIDLIKGNPEKRRNFIDLCYSQISPGSLGYIKKFELLINQRNAQIRNINAGLSNAESLDIWDRQLAAAGAYISFMRKKYTDQLNSSCSELYGKISGGSEKLSISYQSGVFSGDYEYPDFPDESMTELYYKKLKDTRNDDIRLGYTHSGAGRDDIGIKINNLSVKDFGSQGQQKSTALVMRLAQAMIYKNKKNEAPVILLDDVMGELDENRQKFVCSIIDGMQVFITTCNYKAIIHQCDSFHEMCDGRLVN